MTDAELRIKFLKHFYEKRFEGMRAFRCTDIDLALGAIDFGRICKQLKDLGLIEWKSPGGSMISPEGMGLITAKGVDEIERKSHIQDASDMARGKNPNTPPPRGKPSVTAEHGISLLSAQIKRAEQLLAAQSVNGNDFGSWDNTTRNFVEKAFGENHPNVQGFEYLWAFGNAGWDPDEWAEHYAKGLRAKITALNGYIEELNVEIQLREPITPPASRSAATPSKKVFIVHGHNEAIKYELAHSLGKAGLDVTILHEEPNKGRTLLEKFADHAGEAGFAVVLLTADDVGKAKGTTVENLRARQNVVFELGFFCGLLGRKRVCAVYETGVEWPSDLHGLAYVPYDQGGGWKHKVAKEIDAAGIEVDFRKL